MSLPMMFRSAAIGLRLDSADSFHRRFCPDMFLLVGGCSCEDCMASATSIMVGISASAAVALVPFYPVALLSGTMSFFGGVASVAKMASIFVYF